MANVIAHYLSLLVHLARPLCSVYIIRIICVVSEVQIHAECTCKFLDTRMYM